MPDNKMKIVPLILLLLFYIISLLLYPQLPERYPVHFGLSGEPDSWMRKSLLNWFLLPLFSTALTLLMLGIGKLTRRYPKYMNIPSKEIFLALDDAAKESIYREFDMVGYVTNIVLIPLFMILQASMYLVALGAYQRLPWFAFVAIFLSMAILTTYALWKAGNIEKRIKTMGGK